jgi:MFS family permease
VGTLSIGQRRYALGLLMAVGLFNFIDRQCMSILIVPIRHELNLSDTQIGVLTGLAFSLVYTLMAVPLARWADNGSRTRVIVLCLLVWSLMTAGSGLATGFVMLAILRMGVAIGEAGCVPTTTALLSDIFPATRLPPGSWCFRWAH